MSNSLARQIKGYINLENIIFLVIILSILFYLFFQVVILKTSSPQVAVTTTSMVPTYMGFDLQQQGYSPQQYYDILRGDLLVVQNIEPHVGDVIVFQAPGQSTPIVHRIVAEKVENGLTYFATKGDHNERTDAGDSRGNQFGWIPRTSVLGVVVFSFHYLGWFSLQLQDPFIRTVLIVATLGIIVLSFYDSFKSKEDSKSDNLKKETKKSVYIKIKGKKLKLNRSTTFAFSIIFLLTLTYFSIGFVNYSSGHNSVQWLPANADEKSGIINLQTKDSFFAPEKYSNLYMYDYLIQINSSGSLNFVNKVTITPVFHINNQNITNPTYTWTIVYDFSGSKLIHSVFIFDIPQNLTNTSISTTLTFTVYSSGLLASPVQTTTMNITVLI